MSLRVAKSFKLPPRGQGTSFYRFDVSNPKEFKDLYRQRLADSPVAASDIDALVAEANLAFELNTQLFAEYSSTSSLQPFALGTHCSIYRCC